MLVLLTALAKVLLVLCSRAEEAHHDLLHDAGLAKGLDPAGHKASLLGPSLSHLRVLLLSCQSFLIKECQVEQRLCRQSLQWVMVLGFVEELEHFGAHLPLKIVGTALSSAHQKVERQQADRFNVSAPGARVVWRIYDFFEL